MHFFSPFKGEKRRLKAEQRGFEAFVMIHDFQNLP